VADARIPPGQGVALWPDKLEGVRSDCGFSGLLLDGRGRLSVSIKGQGVRATFADPDALRALAGALLAVADQRDADAALVAATASADLERITAAYTLDRKHDA